MKVVGSDLTGVAEDSAADDGVTEVKRRHFAINGVVQGVGFRPFVHHLAGQLGLNGWVCNTAEGVELELQGPDAGLDRFQSRLETDAPPLAHIAVLETWPVLPVWDEPSGLAIRPSDHQRAGPARTLVSPDIATCPQCLHELGDVTDRRYRYPFINCTDCGPRFTIVNGLPYDRPLTTMTTFPLCSDCGQEYDDPGNRRFHAQPVACSDCGPEIWFVPSQSDQDLPTPEVFGEEALKVIDRLLGEGGVVAIKGLGGFHLAARADNETAVLRIRELKVRPHKPLAIMVSDAAMARQFCYVNSAEEALLTSTAAPIVLLRPRNDLYLKISSLIALQNNAIGVMLPYTPLHHLLLQSANGPLVMTSGNWPGEPLCTSNEEAWLQLRPLCDGLLLHNRAIAHRCDDSVLFAADSGGEIVVQSVRRSRGFVPIPVRLPEAVALEQPLAAAGADLKNVSAVAVDGQVFLTQHIGNLDKPEVRAEQMHTIFDFERLFKIQPQVIVCDSHPNYASSRYAQKRAREEGLKLVEVQHHHAHIAGCLAENEYTGAAIGLAFDGTGYGRDGRIWGGEVLLADLTDFERLYQLEYLPLPGGDAAVRRPYRIAIAYLLALCPQLNVSALFPHVSSQEMDIIQAMVREQLNTPLTSSMGRLFDAVSALLGLCHESTYEAQAAMALEAAAWQSEAGGRYYFSLEEGQIRLGRLLCQITADRLRGAPTENIARRFHNTIAAIAVAAAQAVTQERGKSLPVALSGGVWQNRLLLEITVPQLREAGFEVLLHRQVPANDGGLAYGQTAVAAARLKGMLCA